MAQTASHVRRENKHRDLSSSDGWIRARLSVLAIPYIPFKSNSVPHSVFMRQSPRRRGDGFASKVENRAPTARQYKSQGQARSEAERVAPGYEEQTLPRPEGPKYTGHYALSGLEFLDVFDQGRRAPLRCALAPGFHIPRHWRCESYICDFLRQSPRRRGDEAT